MIQAHTLDAIFNNLTQRASQATYMDDLDRYLRLGLKAQSQCRATLETLATIKNPSVVFARQANIEQGPQQVNNRNDASGRALRGPAENRKVRQTNCWRRNRMNGWTPERRAPQSAAIQQWRPWEHSTGPKSEEGKGVGVEGRLQG